MAQCHADVQEIATAPPEANPGPTAARLADLHERIRAAERRLTDVRVETGELQGRLIDEATVADAMMRFDPVWESLSPGEQGRLLRLLVERVDYDGKEGMLMIAVHAAGLQTLPSARGAQ